MNLSENIIVLSGMYINWLISFMVNITKRYFFNDKGYIKKGDDKRFSINFRINMEYCINIKIILSNANLKVY